MFSRNKNIKILINYGLGPVLFAWLSFSIYRQIKQQSHLYDALHAIRHSFTGAQSWKIYVVLLLVLFNWGIEARKWQLLLRVVEKISWWNSFKAVLAGLAFSMNTPNRIGEYGGRVLYVQDGHRWKALSLTIAGSFSQLIITLVMGMAGLAFMQLDPTISARIAGYALWIRVMFTGSLLITVVLVLLYYRMGSTVAWIEKIPRSEKLTRHLKVLENLPVTILLRTMALSFIRYMIFVIQYILLLQLFLVTADAWHCFWLVTVLYFVLALVPTIALAELAIRGQIGIMLFRLVSDNNLGIAGASAAIWFINLVLPALAGSLLFLSLKIFSDK